MCSLPCCKSRKKAPRLLNADGEETAKSIDDPHGEGLEEDGYGFDFDDLWGDGDSSGSDLETDEPPALFERKRANAVCVEVYGAWNQRRTFEAAAFEKTEEDKAALKAALLESLLFQQLASDEGAMTSIVNSISINDFAAGERIVAQGDPGDAVYVILRGGVDCYRQMDSATEPPPELPGSDKVDKGTLVNSLAAGKIFGELAILWNVPRSLSVYAQAETGCSVGRLDRHTHQNLVVNREMDQRESRQKLLKKVQLLEMMTPEQLAKLTDALKLKCYQKGENLITQNDEGREFFIMLDGEAVATVATFFLGIEVDVQEHRRYHAGDLFGERALLKGDPRAASITACDDHVRALRLSRGKFERLVGPMNQLQEGQYLADPRKLIADFYSPGSQEGPKGSVELRNDKDTPIKEKDATVWFAVYRPTSRDAIAKMLSGHAVGKGLNVKGKSAKKGVLSGFVPFLQISDNDHKDKIEEAPAASRIKLYFRSKQSRDDALAKLYAIMFEAQLEVESKTISPLDDYAPAAFGMEVPEPVLIEAYIKRPNIVPRVGWETGRASEPAFMDLNMHAVRGDSEPKVVLMQFDEEDPMNPRGLLIAYAEQFVKPVVSDFDTFTVGSRGMKYEPIPVEQAELAIWALKHLQEVLETPGELGWTGRWLEILKVEGEKGFHPEFPKYGFGDPTSYGLIGDVVTATISCGAVRHGAECFNFYFPQELDDEYLVVWEGFPDKPWDYANESGLREFLQSRAEESYSFPLNPVWPVRDKGWHTVLEKMLANDTIKTTMKAWDPVDKVLPMMQELHAKFPDGFVRLNQEKEDEERNRSTVPDMFGHDLMGCEKSDFAEALYSKHMKLKKAMTKLKAMNTLGEATPKASPEAAPEFKDQIVDDQVVEDKIVEDKPEAAPEADPGSTEAETKSAPAPPPTGLSDAF